jgi:hypothetical protein
MSHSAGSGDKLARGAIKATYLVSEDKRISQKKWDEMFEGFDPEKFKKDGMPKVKGEAATPDLG